MSYGLRQTVAPAEEPVTVAEAKAHARVDHSQGDTVFAQHIAAARRLVEAWTGLQLVTATWQQTEDCFPSGGDLEIRLKRNPVQSVSSVTYVDADGVTQTVSSSDYHLSTRQLIARLRPAYGKSWPAARDQMDAVTVTYIAGYGAASAVDPDAKQAIHFLVTHWWYNPETVLTSGAIPKDVPYGVRSLIDSLMTGEL